jgi:hypothetical protein
MQPETRFKLRVQKRLKLVPNLWQIKVQQVALRGIPDILICYKGHFIAWELKVPPNKVKQGSLQEYNLEMIKQAGGISREVTPENFEQCLKEILCLKELPTGSINYLHEQS